MIDLKELTEFIEKYTNAMSFYEAPYTHEEQPKTIHLEFIIDHILGNILPLWFIDLQRQPELNWLRSEGQQLLYEERLMHPIIAMMEAEKNMVKIINDISKIQCTIYDELYILNKEMIN